MPTIPLYYHQGNLGSSAGVRADPGMHGAQYRAAGELAAQVGGLGQRLEEAREYKLRTQMQLDLDRDEVDFGKWMQGNGDERKWVEERKRRVQAISQRYEKEASTPRIREVLRVQAEQYALRSERAVSNAALAKGAREATVAGNDLADQMVQAGDVEAAKGVWEEMAAKGLIFREQIPILVRGAQAQAQRVAVQRGVSSEPLAMLEQLKEKTKGGQWAHFDRLDEAERYAYLRKAQAGVREVQRQRVEDFTRRIDAQEVLTTKEIEEAVEAGALLPSAARRLVAYQKTGKFNQAEFGELRSEALRYDAKADVEGEEYTRILQEALGYPAVARSEILKALNRSRGGKGAAASEAAKEVLKAMRERMEGGYYVNFMTMQEQADGVEKPVVDWEKKKQAQRLLYEVEVELGRWLEDNPNASAVQMHDFIDRLELQKRKGGLSSDVLGSLGINGVGKLGAVTAAGGGEAEAPLSLSDVDKRPSVDEVLKRALAGPKHTRNRAADSDEKEGKK